MKGKGRPTGLTALQMDLLKEMLREGELTYAQIGDELGIRKSTVQEWATRFSLDRRSLREAAAQAPRRTVVIPLHELLPQIRLGSWAVEALCAETDPELFYPEKGGSTREAKNVCRECPVTAECLEYALTNHERFGIWGGVSERERRKLERKTS